MTKEEFLHSLSSQLRALSAEERAEMLYDYEEHLREAMEQGLSEEKAVESLGSPKIIAKELLADYYVQQAEHQTSVESVSRAIFATISLGLLNLIFVLGPVLAVTGLLLGLFALSVGMIMGPLAAAMGFAFASAFIPFGILWSGTSIFPLLFVVGLGVLLLVLTLLLTKWLGQAFLAYLKFNLKVIKGGH